MPYVICTTFGAQQAGSARPPSDDAIEPFESDWAHGACQDIVIDQYEGGSRAVGGKVLEGLPRPAADGQKGRLS